MAEVYDFIVIGGGSAGLAAARRASKYGQNVLIVEGKKYGGTCVNVGCIPKKILWNGSNILEEVKMASQYAISVSEPHLNFRALQAKVKEHVQYLNGRFSTHLDNERIKHVESYAKFVNANTIEAAGNQYTAPKILIATGSKPIKLPIPGNEHIVDSDYIFEMEELPRRIALIGNGYIATEMAGILA